MLIPSSGIQHLDLEEFFKMKCLQELYWVQLPHWINFGVCFVILLMLWILLTRFNFCKNCSSVIWICSPVPRGTLLFISLLEYSTLPEFHDRSNFKNEVSRTQQQKQQLKMGCHVEATYFKPSNSVWSVDTVLWGHSLITLQAARKLMTHIYVTAVCHSALETHELFTPTQAHTPAPVSNQCARPHEPRTWITSSGSTGRPQVKRDPKGPWMWRQGLDLTFSRNSVGTEPKGDNNSTVEMCRSGWKRSLAE